MKTKTLKQDKVNVITLGCSKNLVDSENIITQLKGNDYEVVHDSNEDDSNIIIVNTCGFIDLAKEESVDTILQYAEVKKQGEKDQRQDAAPRPVANLHHHHRSRQQDQK